MFSFNLLHLQREEWRSMRIWSGPARKLVAVLGSH